MSRQDRAKEMRAAVSLSAQGATNAQAATMPTLYGLWAPGTAYGGEGQPSIVRRPGGQLYRVRQAHTAQTGWEPENTAALWAAIDKAHAGTAADPAPAARGMEYVYGKHYLDGEDGKTYLCTRTGETEGGKIVLQYLPHELVGQYFEEVS